MALNLFTLATCLVNGLLLTMESQVTVDRDARAQEIETTALGFAGFSPGAPVVRIEVENAVPSLDFELNPGQFFLPQNGGLQIVELTVFAAGRTLTSKGMIIKDNFRHGVNSPARLGFSFVGQPADWT